MLLSRAFEIQTLNKSPVLARYREDFHWKISRQSLIGFANLQERVRFDGIQVVLAVLISLLLTFLGDPLAQRFADNYPRAFIRIFIRIYLYAVSLAESILPESRLEKLTWILFAVFSGKVSLVSTGFKAWWHRKE